MDDKQRDFYLKEIKPIEESEKIFQIVDRFTQAYTFRANYDTRWDKAWEYYRSKDEFKEKKDETYPNLKLAIAFQNIETLLPQIMNAIFANKILIQILPTRPEEVDQAKIINQLILQQLRQAGFYTKALKWIKSCLIYGTSYMLVYWDFKKRKMQVREPIFSMNTPLGTVKIGSRIIEKDIILYDAPQIDYIKPYDLYVDPRATCIKDARWVIRRVWKDYDYLIEMEQQGRYKNMKYVTPGVGYLEEILRSAFGETEKIPTGQLAEDRHKVELLECYEPDRIMTLANRTVLIRDTENEFWHGEIPIIDIRDYVLPDVFYGVGEIEPIESYIHEKTAIRNLRLKNVKDLINRRYVGNQNADCDFGNLEYTNIDGGVLMTDDIHNTIKPLDDNPQFYNTLVEEQMIDSEIKEISGLSGYTTGQTPKRAETATTMRSFQQSFQNRLSMKIQNIVNSGLMELVKKFIQLNQQYLTKKQAVRIAGAKGWEFEEISAEDIPLELDLVPNIGAMEYNKDMKKQQLLMAMQTKVVQAPNINIPEVQRDMLEDIVDDVDRVVGEMPQQQPIQEPQGGGEKGHPGSPKQPKQAASQAGVGGTPLPKI